MNIKWEIKYIWKLNVPFKITILINIRVIFNKMEKLQDQKMVFSAFHKRSGKLKIQKIMQIQHFLMLIYFFTLCSIGKTKVSFYLYLESLHWNMFFKGKKSNSQICSSCYANVYNVSFLSKHLICHYLNTNMDKRGLWRREHKILTPNPNDMYTLTHGNRKLAVIVNAFFYLRILQILSFSM